MNKDIGKGLVVIDPEVDIAEIFVRPVMDDLLSKIRKEKELFQADVNTARGRKEIGSFAGKISSSKVWVNSIGKTYVKELKKIPGLVDAECKYFRDECDQMRDEVLAPRVAWQKTRDEVDVKIKRLVELKTFHMENSCFIAGQIERLVYFDEEIVPDKKAEFDSAMSDALAAQFGFLTQLITEENEAEELERLRAEEAKRKQKEREDKIAKDAADKATREAEAAARARVLKAKLDKEQAEKREREAVEQAERVKRDAKELADRAARDAKDAAETEILQAKLATEKAEQETKVARSEVEKRIITAVEEVIGETKNEHRSSKMEPNTTTSVSVGSDGSPALVIENAERSFRINGYGSHEAKRIVSLIYTGQIKNVTMNF